MSLFVISQNALELGLTSNSDKVVQIWFGGKLMILNQLSSQKTPNCSTLAHMTESDPLPAAAFQIGPVPVRYTLTRWE